MILNINGKDLEFEADPVMPLLWALRDILDIKGPKFGCGVAACGACTVLIDGVPARACMTSVGSVADREIRTIEGLEQDGQLHPVQQGFLDADALQCGYCTAGMIMSAVALLERNKQPSRAEIVRAMNGNVCRCCAYPRIMTAVETAASAMRGEGGVG